MQAQQVTLQLETNWSTGWVAAQHFVYRDANGWHLCFLQQRRGTTVPIPISDGLSFYETQLLFSQLTGVTLAPQPEARGGDTR